MKRYEGCTRVLIWFMALLLGALAGGCGGGGGGQDPVPSAGPSPIPNAGPSPTVTAVTPRPNVSGVLGNTRIITAIFSQPMDPATLTPDSFTLACPIGTTP